MFNKKKTKCFSLSKKNGLVITFSSKSPVKICFNYLDYINYYGVIAGNSFHSSNTLY